MKTCNFCIRGIQKLRIPFFVNFVSGEGGIQILRSNYILGKNITIDESLLHFTGRNKMKFYIPMKPHKWGFKMHLLCDSDTHYLYNILFDPGKDGKKFIYF